MPKKTFKKYNPNLKVYSDLAFKQKILSIAIKKKKLKLKTIVADQQMRSYTNSKYRFNVCLYNKF